MTKPESEETMNLYEYLRGLDYTEAEAEESVLRWEAGMELPAEIEKDIKEFYRERRKEG